MKRVFVAGHKGMVGSALCRAMAASPDIELITVDRSEVDLRDQRAVADLFSSAKIDEIFLAAAKVGGIHANNHYPADFIYDNLMIQTNVIHAAYTSGASRLLFLGSSCIYPKHAPQPISETSLLSGHLESTNEPYAISKIAGIKLCESYNRQYGTDFRSVMPTNLYGPGDNYHSLNSHVIPGLIRRIHEAHTTGLPSVSVWGSGNALREFLYVDDFADACIFVARLSKEKFGAVTDAQCAHINVGSGFEVSIKQLVEQIVETIGYQGDICWDTSQPDGTPRKLLDRSLLRELGWDNARSLNTGLRETYAEFLNGRFRK